MKPARYEWAWWGNCPSASDVGEVMPITGWVNADGASLLMQATLAMEKQHIFILRSLIPLASQAQLPSLIRALSESLN
ncbi:hypothetical protein [Pseudomonas sp.]|uniref:hypothetical protein n=1 Tax=Pseudomonas sp. TaxID=306 RepID=UPI0028AAC0FE|nr:hypothetical protein [Pseudomonas sp.]